MKLQKCKCIGLTTDAWTSISQKSFITITAHIIDEDDDDFNLVAYVLDTQEIIKRHTSENLLQHIQNVLKDYDIDVENNHKLTLNYNATNSTDIHEQDIETADEVNYLNPETDTAELIINDDSQTQFDIQGNDIMQDEINSVLYNQNSNHSTQSNDTEISGGHDLTFTSDNAGDISKALKKLGQYRWFGCAGHHLNLIAQAGFKQVQSAASLVKKCKKIVEHIKSSSPASYLLIKYQEILELPMHRVMQENNTRWWSILLMMQSLTENKNAITLVLAEQNKSYLIITPQEHKEMLNIIILLKPFKECGEKLSSENNVTISLIIPLFNVLKQHLAAKLSDSTMIQNMKQFMLAKMKTRYTAQQTQFLTTCTLLDIRYKNTISNTDAIAFDQLEKDVKQIMEDQEQESQQVIPATQGQQLHMLSSFDRQSIFDFEDDVSVDSPSIEFDTLTNEIRRYKSLRMSKDDKERCNVLNWWKVNKCTFPCLFKAALYFLHIPATSVPSERIFSLAGYIVRDRRSKLLAANVNKFIFLKKNKSHIPIYTPILNEVDSN